MAAARRTFLADEAVFFEEWDSEFFLADFHHCFAPGF
jgi:hypothetical protein